MESIGGCASRKTVFHYFNLWSKLRLFENAFYNMSKTVQSCVVIVDCSFIKNVCGRDVVGRNPTDRGATKVSLITNEHGRLLAFIEPTKTTVQP